MSKKELAKISLIGGALMFSFFFGLLYIQGGEDDVLKFFITFGLSTLIATMGTVFLVILSVIRELRGENEALKERLELLQRVIAGKELNRELKGKEKEKWIN